MARNNNYKQILSQLFDVRPMKNSADLDWEAIKIVDKILDLKNAMTKQEIRVRRETLILRPEQNIRDLRENESVIFIKGNINDYQKKPVKIRSFAEIEVYPQLLFDDYFAAIKQPENFGEEERFSFIRENGELPLTPEDALRELEKVDARDNIIENIVDFIETDSGEKNNDHCRIPDTAGNIAVSGIRQRNIKFKRLIILAFAAFSVFSAAFFWNKTNNSGELISASSYQSIVAGVREMNNGDSGISIKGFNVRQSDISFSDFFSFLGKYGGKYLLIFQNSAETRATGGAAEFYGILEIENGTAADFSIDEILNLDAKLTENIIPPRPLQKISTSWGAHDANWFPDFPSSARQLSSFYAKISGETVDGVIAFNSAVIADILAIIGPIKLDNYGDEINADNVWNFLAQRTDNLKLLLKEEKNFFPRFARLLLDKISLLNRTGQEQAAAVLLDNLNKRNIQPFFNDAEAQNIISGNNWGGEMPASDGDFLSVINSSVDGYKNDGNIQETINHKSEIQADGSVIDTVKIVKDYKKGDLNSKLSNLMDYNYLRVYVPLGSELLEVKGLNREDYYAPIDYEKNDFQRDVEVSKIEQETRFHESGAAIFQENGKTVFGGWVYAAPGRDVAVTYKYKLPFKLSKKNGYSLTVRKQSGSMDTEFTGTIEAANNFIVKDKSGNLSEKTPWVYEFVGNLTFDVMYGVEVK